MVLPRLRKQPPATAAAHPQPQGHVSFQTNDDDNNENMQPGLASPPLPLTPYPHHKKKRRVLSLGSANHASTANYPHNNDDDDLTSLPEKEVQDDDKVTRMEYYGRISEEDLADNNDSIKEQGDELVLDINEQSRNNTVHDTTAVVTENNNNVDNNMTTTATADATTTPASQEEPDWDKLKGEQEPAKTDVPIFLAARDRRYEAEERFETALDECHASLKQAVDSLLQIAANVHIMHTQKMDGMEMDIRQHVEDNHEARVLMQQRLQESAEAAQGLFAKLLMRVSQPLLHGMAAASSAIMTNTATAFEPTTNKKVSKQQEEEVDP